MCAATDPQLACTSQPGSAPLSCPCSSHPPPPRAPGRPAPPPPPPRRYYIGSDKLAHLGWTEEVSWEDGLRKTIDWYLSTNCGDYWQGDLEAALRPHPLLVGTSLTADPARLAAA
jgi:hypothetical protein